jgi:hypothetical protein
LPGHHASHRRRGSRGCRWRAGCRQLPGRGGRPSHGRRPGGDSYGHHYGGRDCRGHDGQL